MADNIIVAAGSVVIDSFSTERIIIGGNPARIISTWDRFFEKSKMFARGQKTFGRFWRNIQNCWYNAKAKNKKSTWQLSGRWMIFYIKEQHRDNKNEKVM